MRTVRFMLLPVLAVALAACEPNEEAAQLADPGQVDSVARAMSGGDTTSVAFSPVGGSAVAGTARLLASGDRTRVLVELTGAEGAGIHQGHVHRGTSCAEIGEVAAPLQPVATNDQGHGTVASTAEMRMGDLLDGKYLVVYHQADGNPGQPVACAVLPETRSPL